MLTLDATPGDLAAARRALAALDEERFAALFDPEGPRPGATVEDELASPLVQAGLAARDGARLAGRHRIRREGGRFYALELGGGAEYRQDLWPETDALLEALATIAPGALLDLGTGSGVLAIEAAARGHRVVATDLYPSALALARWNAALNGSAPIDLRAGHLFEPVAGARFDAILAAPHYTRLAAQLRLEVLHGALAHLRPGGKLFLATVLEWRGDGPLAVEPLLAALPARASVRPIEARRKRDWFTAADGLPVPSRGRFLVELEPAPAPAPPEIERPALGALPIERFVPLSRLARGATAAVTDRSDVAALGALLDALARGRLILDEPPARLLDACRFGARPCATGPRAAASAILEASGAILPCAHGAPIGDHRDPLAALEARLGALAAEAEARRGCPSCPARDACSRCLFPNPLDEPAYCDFVRAHAPSLPALSRLLALTERLARAGRPGPLEVRLGPPPPGAGAPDPAARAIADRLRARDAWLVTAAGTPMLSFDQGERDLSDEEALAAAGLFDGADAPALARALAVPKRLARALDRLARALAG